MSTNNGLPNGWPDEASLENLANAFFKAAPGQEPKFPNPSDFDHLPMTEDGGSHILPQDQYSFMSNGMPTHHLQQGQQGVTRSSTEIPNVPMPGSGNIPASVAGSGISPSAINQPGSFSIDNPPTSLPDPNSTDGRVPSSVAGSGISPSAASGAGIQPQQPQSAIPTVPSPGSGNIPASVAGSGISPSAIHHPGAFNIDDPQTSLPDPHFTRQQQAQKGSSSSPLSITKPFSLDQFPYFGEAAIGKDMQEVLSYIPMSHVGEFSQIPDPGSYYFLAESWMGEKPFTARQPSVKPAPGGMPRAPFDVNHIRNDFPIFRERVNGKPLIWLDNAATTQKPKSVIDRVSYFYEHENSNIHRAAHELAARATDAYEDARKKIQHFLNARSPKEIVFVRGTTEAINLVAKSWGEQNLVPGDEIIITHLEHHANIVPWYQLAKKNGLRLRVIPVDDTGQVLLDEYAKLLNPKTKLVSFTQVSNALGTVTPAKVIIEMAKAAGAKVLLDGAQSVSHMRADVQALDCDWFVFSGHKIFAPTGIGVLYGKEDLLNATEPWQGGGNMIEDVTFEHVRYQKTPARYEAGTGNIADAVGLGAAIDYVMKLGIEFIEQYEHFLLQYAIEKLKFVPGLKFIGMPHHRAGVISLIMEGYKTEEVGAALNQDGIAVRSGHHCAQPILRRFGVETSVRPSIALYNSCSDIDALVDSLIKLKK